MNGVCQTCGAVAPLEWFLVDGKYKQCLVVMADLPREVAPAAVRYFALFRPASGRAMSADKALRLLEEIAALVGAGYVQVDNLVARPCPPRIWAEAMDQMRQSPKLRLPMKNHNYLRQVAYDRADAADAAAERKRNEDAVAGQGRHTAHDEEPSPLAFDELTEREFALLPEWLKEKHQENRRRNQQGSIMGDGE